MRLFDGGCTGPFNSFIFSRQGSFYYWDMFYSFRNINYASASTPENHNIGYTCFSRLRGTVTKYLQCDT